MNAKKICLVTLFCLISGCQVDQIEESTASSSPSATSTVAPAPINFPDKITYANPGLLPEGIDYDSKCQCFIVSSVGKGQIGKVDQAGQYSILSTDEEVISSIGLLVDQSRNRLLVAHSDNGRGEKTSQETEFKVAKLGIYELDSGKKIHMVELAELLPGRQHFANDIAIDKEGNAYVTDSFASAIYKVTPEGNASVFVENEGLGVEGGFGLNGIVYHPDGYLIAAKSGNNTLLKIPMDNPNSFSVIAVDSDIPDSPDGLELLADKSLAVMANRAATVLVLSSSDAWKSAKIVKTSKLTSNMPTTIVAVEQDIFATEAGFGLENPQEFSIEKAKFE